MSGLPRPTLARTSPVPDPGVPASTKLFFGVGAVAEGTQNAAFNAFLLFYYNQVLGVSGTLSGAAIFIALCVDAVADPLVGFVSDHTRSRWGRRHPYMYLAALPMALCFVLLFHPPALGERGLFVWLCAFAIGVRVSMTLYVIPSSSMLPELTSHYDDRTTLVAYRFLFAWIGGLIASLVGYLVFFAPSARFENGQLDPEAYGGFALLCAAMVFAAILASSAGTHRLIRGLRAPTDGPPPGLARFISDVRDALANPSYRTLLIASLFASTAGGFNDVVGLYVNTYFWGLRTSQIGLLVAGLFGSVVLAFAIARPLTARFDKKRAAVGMACFGVAFGPLLVFARLAGIMPPNGHPLLMPILFVHVVLLVTAVVVIGIVVASMIADVVDENELATGRRQEGMFVAAIAFTTKASSGLGGLIAGLALDLIRFPRLADPATVPPDKVWLLGMAVGPGVLVLFLLTLLFLGRYRITRERHREILAALALRPRR